MTSLASPADTPTYTTRLEISGSLQVSGSLPDHFSRWNRVWDPVNQVGLIGPSDVEPGSWVGGARLC